MMRKSLLILGMLATAGFLVALVRGYQGGADAEALQQHLFWALGASLLMLLSHSAILIYLAATRRVVGRLVRELGLSEELSAQAQKHLLTALPAGLLAVSFLVLAAMAGGGVWARFAPFWTHHALIYAALVLQLWAMWRESSALARQDRLIADLDLQAGA
ncbi:MAG: hypothetical protein ABI609_07440 [Acidobacteriota bacterium]